MDIKSGSIGDGIGPRLPLLPRGGVAKYVLYPLIYGRQNGMAPGQVCFRRVKESRTCRIKICSQSNAEEDKNLESEFKRQINEIIMKEPTANPAPLGLLGFGMTTVLLNLKNAGIIEMSAMILAMGVFYGGIAQIIAGIMEWKKANTFGATAFTSYGLFWLTLVGLIVFPAMGWGAAPSKNSMGAYLLMWGLFTTVMFCATLRTNRALQSVFASLAILFFLLAIGDVTGSEVIGRIAGYEGILCGFSAIYTGLAQVLNEAYGRVVLPLCPVK
jgi:succinate-acetate transporter protein